MNVDILKERYNIEVSMEYRGETYLVGTYIDDQVKFGSFLLSNEINFKHTQEDGIIMDNEDLERTIELIEMF